MAKLPKAAHELVLLRHAKSDWNADSEGDFDRPLAKRGKNASKRIGKWIKTDGWTPDYVLSSPSRRTRQTIERVLKHADLDDVEPVWDERLYAADEEEMLDVLVHLPEQRRRVMLVGHNPGLEDLLRRLTDDACEVLHLDKPVPTGALMRFVSDSPWADWPRCGARLVDHIVPRNLVLC